MFVLTRASGGGTTPCTDEGDSIEFSCFVDGSAYFGRADNGDRRLRTYSLWTKIPDLFHSPQPQIMSIDGIGSREQKIRYTSSRIECYDTNSGGGTLFRGNNRDPSAWYHIVIICDSNNPTPNERFVYYMNGIRISDNSTTLGALFSHGSGRFIHIGAGRDSGTGSLAIRNGFIISDFHVIDGIRAEPTEFGRFNTEGIWVPINYSGSYGTWGCHLDFADPLNLGNDVSGNANHIPAFNTTTDNQLRDTPTNNHAIWNQLSSTYQVITVPGDDLATQNPQGGMGVSSFTLPTTGRYYAEITCFVANSGGSYAIGIVEESIRRSSIPWNTAPFDCFIYFGNDTDGYTSAVYDGPGTFTPVATTFGDGDTIGIAMDFDAGNAEFYVNGVATGYTKNISNTRWKLITSDNIPSNNVRVFHENPDTSPFSAPSGYTYWGSSQNIACPAIINPDNYFTIREVSGGANITDLPWNPQVEKTLILAKRADSSTAWRLVDTVRGAGLSSTFLNSAELSDPNGITSFDPSGYTVGTATEWQGDRVDQIWRATPESGFDIVTLSHVNGVPTTVSHNAGGVIENAWIFPRSFVGVPRMWHSPYDQNSLFSMTTSAGASSFPGYFSSTSSDFTMGSSWATGDYVVYVWRSVDGFSKFTTYIGNGSADGTFISTDFTPVVFTNKAASATGGYFNYRIPVNGNSQERLDFQSFASVNNANPASLDFVSNGIKTRVNTPSTNSSGVTYAVLAWGSIPFKYAKGR